MIGRGVPVFAIFCYTLSSSPHETDGKHNVRYDQEAFLGEDAESFMKLTPEESKEELGLCSFSARRSLPTGSEHNVTRLVVSRELNVSLRRDREIWRFQRPSGMERAAVMGNFRKLFHFIRVTGSTQWLGHVLRMSSYRLPHRALFAVTAPGWKKPCGGQQMTWKRGMKKCIERLGRIGVSRLPGWGPKDSKTGWLEILKDAATDRQQWRSCCHFLTRQNA
ncbi:unnamed protein product [Echinostoma caproni]|uniref:Lipocalin n=1 Tax=Echinostoma caproni TaxID=27848 RepID=A0A183A276_9TREM|nr:unnamed protein product [Echinostoma caproni]